MTSKFLPDSDRPEGFMPHTAKTKLPLSRFHGKRALPASDDEY